MLYGNIYVIISIRIGEGGVNMLQVTERSKWSLFWVHLTTIVFRSAVNGRGLSSYGNCNILTHPI